MNYRIVSGHIEVDKRFFGKESLRPGSHLRHMMGLDDQWSQKVQDIQRTADTVRITYGRYDNVYFEDDCHHFIHQMKKDYGDQISGKITVTKIRGMRDFLDMTFDL